MVRTRISPKALTAKDLPVVNAYTQILNKIFFALFLSISYLICFSCSDCLACGLADIRDLLEI